MPRPRWARPALTLEPVHHQDAPAHHEPQRPWQQGAHVDPAPVQSCRFTASMSHHSARQARHPPIFVASGDSGESF